MKLYSYIGPNWIAEQLVSATTGFVIHTTNDVSAWVTQTKQTLEYQTVVATFVIDESGVLRIADRHSEHVACAGAKAVRSAGEITFRLGAILEVIEISNQSTGYCPKPDSWTEVQATLEQIGLVIPTGFTFACEFRRCTTCQTINLVKDKHFICGVCESELSNNYNVQ